LTFLFLLGLLDRIINEKQRTFTVGELKAGEKSVVYDSPNSLTVRVYFLPSGRLARQSTCTSHTYGVTVLNGRS